MNRAPTGTSRGTTVDQRCGVAASGAAGSARGTPEISRTRALDTQPAAQGPS
jgi:hypothetical protein